MRAGDRTAPGGRRIPVVAIVGRPNVGKSTLFNRLLRRRKAITLDTPGVTRDPISEEIEWDGLRLELVDTGGLGGEAEIALADQVHAHTLESVRHADLVVVVLDARAGVNPLDRDTVELLDRMDVPVLYVANKADTVKAAEMTVDFCAIGIDVPFPVSAEHAIGVDALRERIVESLLESGSVTEDAAGGGPVEDAELTAEPLAPEDTVCRVAIVGRPNVGKSSFLNAVVGKQLSLVHDAPGTTRDVVDTLVERDGRRYLLLDTAGMRRPSRVESGVERISVRRSLEAARRADVVMLMIEPLEGLTDQDARIARYAWEEGRALIVVMNKMDLAEPGTSRASQTAEIYRRCPTLKTAPTAFMTVTKGEGISGSFRLIDEVRDAHRLRVTTSDLNRILASAAERRQPPIVSRGRLKLFYATQTSVRPPTIAVFVNREAVPTDYTRFLERCFRESLPLAGTPLRLRYRRRQSH
ncbi:MAG: ribosome biogenesis GTPase Der [Candidatus Binatia bacterium]